jgi:hypothetical protein
VLAELVMRAIDPPAQPLSCLESFYEAVIAGELEGSRRDCNTIEK